MPIVPKKSVKRAKIVRARRAALRVMEEPPNVAVNVAAERRFPAPRPKGTTLTVEPAVSVGVVSPSSAVRRSDSEVTTMIGWAITFLIVALVAAIFGFGGIAGAAVDIAKLIFFVAIVLFAISAVIGLMRGRSPTL